MKNKYMLVCVNTFGIATATFFDAGELDSASEYGDALSESDITEKAELYCYFPGKGYAVIQRWCDDAAVR